MIEHKLILLTRSGCCLCEGLEERLWKLSLDQLEIPIELCVRDIDTKDATKAETERYSLEVPVLLLELSSPLRRFKLQRVSPRLDEEALLSWLQTIFTKTIRNDFYKFLYASWPTMRHY